MISELDIAGIFIAPIVAYGAISIPIFFLLRWVLALAGFWRFVWHPALFEVSLYLVILSLLVIV
jgi:protein AaeX